jgi:hypothetical protein
MIDTTKLRELAQAAEGYGSCKYAWPHDEHDGVAVVGQIHDGETYPVAEIDTGQYFANEEAIKLAEFYAAANPATVLALLDELDRLRTIEAAARNLAKVKGRHHSDQAYQQLERVLK